ncbi:MAG: DNA cytosine methyltransferase [Burkholderiaceae bacterium]|nr:DNA cytosine methyltransferase [Burkholderiaceae bacterium]
MTRYREWPEHLWLDADAVVGGPPCQAFSVAGSRAGLADARGNLTLTYANLIDHADHVRRAHGRKPVVALYENVPGLLSSGDNAFGCLLAGLAGEDEPLQPAGKRWTNAGGVCGPARTVAWRTLDAQHFGLAQRRRRVFVVASARAGFDPLAVLLEWDGVRRDTAPSRCQGEEAAAGTRRGAPSGDHVGPLTASHGPNGHGGSALHGDQHVLAWGGNDTRGPIDAAAALNANRGCHNPGDFEAGTLLTVVIPIDMRQASRGATMTNNRKPGASGGAPGTGIGDDGDPSPTVSTSHAPAIAFNARQDPDSWIERTGPLDTFSNTQAAAVTGDITHTLNTANNGKGCSEDGTGRGVPTVAVQGMQVRRLTPEECEALQGFPRGYTQVPYRGKPAADGPRYAAIGNSWAVPCVRWIAARINEHLGQ